MKSTLYELTEQYQYLLDMLCDDDCDEQVVLDTLEGIDGEIEDKADGYAKIIRELEGQSHAILEEEERLAGRRKKIDNRINRLRNSLTDAMRKTGKTKFQTMLFSFSIRKNGGKTPLVYDDYDAIPEKYCIPQPPKPDTNAIREALENGEQLPFAHLGERGENLQIR